MANDAEITIAFIFKRSGKKELSKSEFYLPLSMELKWFSPQEAKDFVKSAIKQKLIIEKNELLKPSFNIDEIKIPIGFQPSKQIIELKEIPITEEKKDILADIVKKICEKTKFDEKIIFENIKKIENEKNITPEVAALLIGIEHNIELTDYYNKIKNQIYKK